MLSSKVKEFWPCSSVSCWFMMMFYFHCWSDECYFNLQSVFNALYFLNRDWRAIWTCFDTLSITNSIRKKSVKFILDEDSVDGIRVKYIYTFPCVKRIFLFWNWISLEALIKCYFIKVEDWATLLHALKISTNICYKFMILKPLGSPNLSRKILNDINIPFQTGKTVRVCLYLIMLFSD